MNTRRHLSILLLGWGSLGLIALAVSWVVIAGRLPDPIAVHWTHEGADASLPVNGWFVAIFVMWLVGTAVAAIALATRTQWRHRVSRRTFLASLMGWGGFTVGIHASMITANLDASNWRETATSAFAILLVLLPAAGFAGLGWFLAGTADEASRPQEVSASHIPVGDRVVWATRVSAPWAVQTSVAALVLAIVTAALAVAGTVAIPLLLPVVFLVVSAAGTMFTSCAVTIGDRGVLIRFGVIGWPVWRIRLADIESAGVQDRQALEVGGWGLRSTPHATALMLRSGDCLAIRRNSRKNAYISIDDAASAAALINGLIERDRAAL